MCVASMAGRASTLAILLLLLWLRIDPCEAFGRKLATRVVTTKFGGLRGLINTLPNKHLQPVEMFLGIPFAPPPVGYLRFMPPMSLTPWRSVRLADRFGPVCPQKYPDITNETAALQSMSRGRLNMLKRLIPYLKNQSEDCLYLNVYTPTKVGRNPEKLPVVFYIHGESFEWNSGNPYDGSVLASFGNVVVVTVNFRLGVFGFLSTESVRGNYGLVDLITALHWVEENIEHFGGDPQNVTILGQGHGAALVSLLMISPLAKGAFHRAIVQSGSALSEWAMAKEPQQYAVKLAAALGCPTDKDEEMVICLRDKPFETILAVDLHVPEYLTAFGPTLDGIVLTAAPEQAIKVQNDLFSRYDLLFGVNKYESHLPFSGDDAQFGFEVDKRDRILRTFIANSYSYHLNEIFALLVNEYTDWTKPILHPINIRDATMEVLGDAQVVAPLVKTASYHSSSQGRTFFYNFAYQTKDGDYPQRLGCVHGEELPYVFGAPLVDGLTYFPQNYTKTEKMLSEAVMRYWTNFAKSGDPNQPEKQTSIHGGKNKNRFVKLNWPPYENAHQKYLSIGMRPKIRHHYRAHKLSVWTKLIPEIHHPGDESVGVKHHLFNRHDDPTTFEGNVRHAVPYTHEPPTQSPPYTSINSTYPRPNLTDLIYFGLRPPPPPTPPNAGPVESGRAETIPQAKNQTEPQRVEAIGPGGYSTALSVTIAVGCSLLILNVLIFAGVYYQRDKNRLEAKLQKRSAEQTRKSPHHHEPNVGAMAATHTNTTGSPHQSKGVHLPQQLPPVWGFQEKRKSTNTTQM